MLINSFINYVRRLVLPVTLAVSTVAAPASAQLAPPTGASYGGSVPGSKRVVSGIAWYGVLKDGLAEAKRSGRPILLISGAPACLGVPGVW